MSNDYNFSDLFEEMFGSPGLRSEKRSHPKSEVRIPSKGVYTAKIYTFCKQFSEFTLRPTSSGTFAITNPNGKVVGKFHEINDAKIAYVRLVMGDELWDH
jgi:hypothetical protein